MSSSDNRGDHADDGHVLVRNAGLLIILLYACTSAQFILEKKLKIRSIPAAALWTCIGISIGLILRLTNYGDAIMGLPSIGFYFFLLPPIIFSAGFNIKRHLFYQNLSPILLLAVLGTIISTAAVSLGLHFRDRILLSLFRIRPPSTENYIAWSFMECLCFGSLISATDPVSTLATFLSLDVDPSLFYLVLGESLLNDAVAVTIFKVSRARVNGPHETDILRHVAIMLVCFFASVVFGYTLGLLHALVLKALAPRKDNDVVEVILLSMCLVFLPFFFAELLGLSGVVAALFGGIAVRRYASKNVALQAKKTLSVVLHSLSSLAETTCFALLGLSAVQPSTFDSFDLQLMFCALVLTYFGRALHVYPILTTLNLMNRLSCPGRDVSTCPHEVSLNSQTTQQGTAALIKSMDEADKRPEITHTAFENGKSMSERDVPHSPPKAASPAASSSLHEGSTEVIPLRTMHMVMLAGLRGAMAYSCALIFPDDNGHRGAVVSTTMAITLVTIFVQGGLTLPALKCLKVPLGREELHDRPRAFQTSYDIGLLETFERRFLYPYVLSPPPSAPASPHSSNARQSGRTSLAGPYEIVSASHQQILIEPNEMHNFEEIALGRSSGAGRNSTTCSRFWPAFGRKVCGNDGLLDPESDQWLDTSSGGGSVRSVLPMTEQTKIATTNSTSITY